MQLLHFIPSSTFRYSCQDPGLISIIFTTSSIHSFKPISIFSTTTNSLRAEVRFSGQPGARIKGFLAELYDMLPSHLHDMVSQHTDFDREFRLAARNMRSVMVDRACKAAPVIFNLPKSYFAVQYDQGSVPELRRLLNFKSLSSRVSKHAPLLYPPSVRKRGSAHVCDPYLFQSTEVFQVPEGIIVWSEREKYGGPAMYGKPWHIS
ncbi:hypothetical protein Hypma_009803 [Hypsizygus marmoreus]|uniref:Uncharacterized protein n=1 Tax=Hypsizygus marmoreus TaxID=39966 RepID=A0A369JP12_HYPMA|nr:hypothetical protein Hypma_009803 [Hypsizygus marmoreus]